jgi:hypothetical protein
MVLGRRLELDFGISTTFKADADKTHTEVAAASLLATERCKIAWEELELEFQELSKDKVPPGTAISKDGEKVENCRAASFYLKKFGEDFVLARVKNWRV